MMKNLRYKRASTSTVKSCANKVAVAAPSRRLCCADRKLPYAEGKPSSYAARSNIWLHRPRAHGTGTAKDFRLSAGSTTS